MSFVRNGFGVIKGVLNIQNAMCVCILGEYHQTAHITSIQASYSNPSAAKLNSFSVGSVTVLREKIDKFATYSPHPNLVSSWMRGGAAIVEEPDLSQPLWEGRFGYAFTSGVGASCTSPSSSI